MIGTVLVGGVLLFALAAMLLDMQGKYSQSKICAYFTGLMSVGAAAALFAVILAVQTRRAKAKSI